MVTLFARRGVLILALAAISIVPFAAEAGATPVVDKSFGGGTITPKVFPSDKWAQVARGAVLQADGKVVVAMALSTKFKRRAKRPVLRYNADGTRDKSYGTNGVAWLGVPGAKFVSLTGINLQPDGKTLVAGLAFKREYKEFDFFIARLLGNGRLDRSFGKGGITRLDAGIAGLEGKVGVHPRSDGTTFLTYLDTENSEFGELDVVRLEVDGRIDPSYGSKGVKSVDLVSGEYFLEVPEVAIVGDDAFVLVNQDFDSDDSPCTLLRTNISSNGGPVATFGNGGRVEFGRESTKTSPRCSGLATTSDGGVAVSGWSYEGIPNAKPKGFIYKFQANGSPDPTFGVAGKLTGANKDYFTKIAQVADGGFLAVGGRQLKGPDAVYPNLRGSARPVSSTGTFADIFPAGVVPNTPQAFATQLDHRANGNLALYVSEQVYLDKKRVQYTRIVKFTN
jgi:uncharacterized delta-60 repeat protein